MIRRFAPIRSSVRCVQTILVASLGGCGFASSEVRAETPAVVMALQLAGEARAAARENDVETALQKMSEAVALRPDIPRLQAALARRQWAAGMKTEARESLAQIARLGLGLPAEEVDAFEELKNEAELADVLKSLAANLRPKGAGELGFAAREVTGHLAGLAWQAEADTFLLGDAHARTIWARGKDGKVKPFTTDDSLLGVLSLAVDAPRGSLWSATGAPRGMQGYASEFAGAGELVELDLASGAVRRKIEVPSAGASAGRALRHVTVDTSGAVYCTDEETPAVWWVPPGGAAAEVFAESAELIAPRGLASTDEALFVADRYNGLLRIDLRSRTVQSLESPADSTFFGLESLVLAPDGTLLALQTEVRPNRVLRITLAPDGTSVASVDVLESGHLTMVEPGQACIGPGGDLFFIGNTGGGRFHEPRPSAPRAVPVYKTKLGGKR